jgi:hypothetical protein
MLLLLLVSWGSYLRRAIRVALSHQTRLCRERPCLGRAVPPPGAREGMKTAEATQL